MAKRFPCFHSVIAVLVCLLGSGCTRNPSPSGTEPDQASQAGELAGSPQKPAQSAGTPDNPGPAASPGDVRPVPAEEVARAIKPHLRPGESLAHQVFRGPLGPASDTVLVIVERDGSAGGFVVTPDPDSLEKARRTDLPSLAMGLLDSVVAVFFMDVDSRPGLEIVVMTKQMTGAGPQGAIPRHMNLVLSWTGSAFVRLTEVEERILDMDSAAAIKQTIKQPSNKPGGTD